MKNEQEQKAKEYEKIYYQGLIWKKRFESDYFKNDDTPAEQPFMPSIISNSGKLKVTTKNQDIQNSLQYMINNL